jgi:hypothetical protein
MEFYHKILAIDDLKILDSNEINRRFFYKEPFWDMSKNEGLQIFVKMDLKCSTYGPEHKTERLQLPKIVFSDKNSIMFVDTVC